MSKTPKVTIRRYGSGGARAKVTPKQADRVAREAERRIRAERRKNGQ